MSSLDAFMPKKSATKKTTSARKSTAKKATTASKQKDAKVCAILCYLLIGIVWYYVDENMRKNSYAGFHARQALVLLLASVIWHVASMILIVITFGLFAPIAVLGQILIFVWWLLGIVYAATQKKKALFWIGGFADNFK